MANACLIHLLTYYTVFPTETVSKTGRNVNEQSSLPSKGFLQNTTAGFNAETNKRNGITLTVLPITILIKQASQTSGKGGGGGSREKGGEALSGDPTGAVPSPALAVPMAGPCLFAPLGRGGSCNKGYKGKHMRTSWHRP